MTCYNPLVAIRFKNGATFKSGKPLVRVVGRYSDYKDLELGEFEKFDRLLVPCGQCVGCLLKKSRDWAVRCVHESSLYKRNCFVTLTYNDENLPVSGSISKRDMQLFMKRLRKRCQGFDPVYNADGEPSYPIRFFGCGEYGSLNERPHYHILLFNFDFPDKQIFKISKGGCKLYVSLILSELWPYGFCSIGEVSFDSAAYVARYVFKKVGNTAVRSGDDNRTPEFSLQSRRPGIGSAWLEKYSADVYNYDELHFKGLTLRPPAYYDRIYDRFFPADFERIKGLRQKKMQKLSKASAGRLYYVEEVKKININKKIKLRNINLE